MERLDQDPDCCCEFNPDSDEIFDSVLVSMCCPIHNIFPMECQANKICKCRIEEQ